LQARILDPSSYPDLYNHVQNVELADSITGDAHKMLNVPYDCGFFFSKHVDIAKQVFENVGAAYLKTDLVDTIESPLNIGIENSRRFRALPLYATLRSLGRSGYVEILERQISTARKIADWVSNHDAYELLPEADTYSSNQVLGHSGSKVTSLDSIFVIVLLRARNQALNKQLMGLINASRLVYVSGTQWDQAPAVRVAVANWQVDPDRESHTAIQVLEQVWTSWSHKNQGT
jgi:glutamate/tyrosine decarboxylase-like PLP-dependent enzyme